MLRTMSAVTGLVALVMMMLASPVAMGVPVFYVDADFEGGAADFGGGSVFPGFDSPTNISPSNLDGRALRFADSAPAGSQMQWNRGALPDSTKHFVSFDYFAEPGANITQFLDVPSILRLDVSEPGRHHVDVEYDLAASTARAFLDGVEDNSLLTILAFPAVSSTDIRIANQLAPPGDSEGVFEIDNLVWRGEISVPEPGTLVMLALGLLGFVANSYGRYTLIGRTEK